MRSRSRLTPLGAFLLGSALGFALGGLIAVLAV